MRIPKSLHSFRFSRLRYNVSASTSSGAQVALKYSDGIVIVVKMGKTLKGNIQRTVELLKMSNARILGVIERFQKSAERSGGYGYGYGYEKANQ